ncbi:MAG: (2Fe-2S)-binding protein [Erysipelotrichales bacterium]
MAENKMICEEHQLDYMSIRKAMIQGARTFEDVVELTSANIECDTCKKEMQPVLDSVCGCTNTSMKDVRDAIINGATSVEDVNRMTKAGTDCSRCNALIESILSE